LRKVALKTAVLNLLVIALLAVAGCTTSKVKNSGASIDKALTDHIQLGLNYIGEGNRQMARTHLLKALEIDSRSAGAHHGMALLLQLEQENSLAEDHFKKALAYDRDFTRARNNYAVFLFQEGRFKDAYKQFLAASDDVNYELRPQVFYSLGVTAVRLDEVEAAEDAWKRSLALRPRYAAPYLELAELYHNRENFRLARQYLDAFATLSAPQARSLWLGVRLDAQAGNRDGVASKGLALSKMFPDSPENQRYQEWLKNEAR